MESKKKAKDKLQNTENVILKVDNLSFNNLINYPSFSVEKGTFVFIQGESGCGKTTLLKMLNGTISPSKGSIFFKDTNIDELEPASYRRQVTLVSQFVFLFEGDIRENFRKFYQYLDKPCPKDSVMEKYLHLMCLDFPLDTKCQQLSGGERHRVYLAIFVSLTPLVLLLDEPTSALDSGIANELFSNLRKIAEEFHITVVTVSHDPQLVKKYADVVITLPALCESKKAIN